MWRIASRAGAGSLPRLRGSTAMKIGQQTRIACSRPLRGWRICSTRSEHRIIPTRSWLWMAERVSRAANSFIVSHLVRPGAVISAGGRDVDDQPDGQFAFLDVAFDMRTAGARSDVPVDGTDFISGMVGADLIEVHAPAFEHAPVLAGQQVFDGVPGVQLELAEALVNRVQWHGAFQRR